MEVMNLETKAVVSAVKNEDSTYLVEGQIVKKEDMSSKYGKVKPKEKESKEVNVQAPKVELHGDKLPELFEAIAKASGAMTNLNKGKEAFNYKYITLGQVIDMTRKPLLDNGLSVMNFPSTYLVGDTIIARVELIVAHKDGSYISSVFDVPVKPNGKQALVQSIATIHSYCVRYHRVNLLGIAGEDDTDGK